MRKLPRFPAKLDGLELFRILDIGGDSAIDAPARLDAVLADVRTGVSAALANPATVHGWRTQALFASLVVALDGCQLLTTVDSGEVFVDGEAVKLPDYLLVLRDGRRLVVDVKSVAGTRLDKPVKMSQREMDGLRRYADLVGSELYVACYLSGVGEWALVPNDAFARTEDGTYSVPVAAALMTDSMSLLGDLMVAVVPPMQMDLVPAPGAVVDDAGNVEFTIDDMQLRVGGSLMVEPHEKRAAMFLLRYGSWPDEQVADTAGDVVRLVSFVASPVEAVVDQEFQIVGRLSSMYTRWFSAATSDGGSVTALQAPVEPGVLNSIIPRDFSSDRLHMWRFHIQPRDVTELG